MTDLRWTLRLLRRRPAFAIAIVATLAVTIAALVTAFGLATAVLWRPLPFADADRLVFAWENSHTSGGITPARVTRFRFDEWQDAARAVESMALFGSAGFLVERTDGTALVQGVRVSTNYFDTLRISPVLGRAFEARDAEPGQERVVILSHALWQQAFGGRRDVIGEEIRLSRLSYTVIGVMPAAVFPASPVNPASITLDPDLRQLWVPIASAAAASGNARSHVYGVVARLAAGRTLDDAARELSATADASDPDRHTALLRPFRDQFVRDARAPLMALFAAAFAVLLLACTNLAALQGAGVERRRGELSVRAAVGAGRARLARQFATEAGVLAAAGGVLALLLSQAALTQIPALLPPSVPLLTPPAVDGRAALFTFGVSLLAASVLAAWPFARALTSESVAPRGSTPIVRTAAFRWLVMAQVGLAVALVVSAALLQQSLNAVRGRDSGFVVDRVLVGNVTLAGAAYQRADQVVAAEKRLTEELAQIPGARAVAFAYDHPLEANWIDSFTIFGIVGRAEDARDSAELRIVSPGYFDALGVTVLEGRPLTERDTLGAGGAVVVNEAFVRRFGGALLNRTLQSSTPAANWNDPAVPSQFTIVGIVEDERFKGLERPSEPAFYMSTRQFPQRQVSMLVRTDLPAETLAGAARAAVRRVDRQAPVGSLSSLASILDEQLVTRRSTTHVIDGFAAAALALAGLGLYGLLALLVSSGVKETGIRLALGSSPVAEARRITRECVASAGAGVAGGIALALAAGRLLQTLLVDVSPRDPWTIAAVCGSMLLVAGIAAALPAWRAARVDPAIVLRGQ